MFFANLPFPVGGTFGTTTATDGAYLEGTEWYVPDIDWSNKPKLRSNRIRKLRVVRNSTGAAVLPKRIVRVLSGTYSAQVDQYTNTAAGQGFAADEFLPAAGAAANDLFYVIIEGPAVVSTNGAADATNKIAVGDAIVASTGNGTTNTTMAGRVAVADFATAATGAALMSVARGVIGRALTAAVTTYTNQDLLIDVIRTAL